MNLSLLDSFTTQNVQFHCIEAGKTFSLGWMLSVAKEKLSRMLAILLPFDRYLLANAVSRRHALIMKALNQVRSADLVIGHNPGALMATVLAGKRFKAKIGFDVEDYHPGEGNDVNLQNNVKRLMECTLPSFDYVSFAAPLIEEKVKQDIPLNVSKTFTLLNLFSGKEFQPPKAAGVPFKLVWFSQHITYGRGLETVLPFLRNQPAFELHLFGHADPIFVENEIDSDAAIVVHEPLPQQELHAMLATFDIGLALEQPVDENRALCITNKLLAYLQAGLYVLATDTKAQRAIFQSLPAHGAVLPTELSEEVWKYTLTKIIDASLLSNQSKQQRFQFNTAQNWEIASASLESRWQALLEMKK